MPTEGVLCEEEAALLLAFHTRPDAYRQEDEKIDGQNQPVGSLHIMGVHIACPLLFSVV